MDHLQSGHLARTCLGHNKAWRMHYLWVLPETSMWYTIANGLATTGAANCIWRYSLSPWVSLLNPELSHTLWDTNLVLFWYFILLYCCRVTLNSALEASVIHPLQQNWIYLLHPGTQYPHTGHQSCGVFALTSIKQFIILIVLITLGMLIKRTR